MDHTKGCRPQIEWYIALKQKPWYSLWPGQRCLCWLHEELNVDDNECSAHGWIGFLFRFLHSSQGRQPRDGDPTLTTLVWMPGNHFSLEKVMECLAGHLYGNKEKVKKIWKTGRNKTFLHGKICTFKPVHYILSLSSRAVGKKKYWFH